MRNVESLGEQVINENFALWNNLRQDKKLRWKFNDIIAESMEYFRMRGVKIRYDNVGFESLRYQQMAIYIRWQQKYWKMKVKKK